MFSCFCCCSCWVELMKKSWVVFSSSGVVKQTPENNYKYILGMQMKIKEKVQVEREAQIETQTQAQVSSGIICARSQHKQRSKVCSCCVSRGRWTSAPKCKQNLKDKYALKKLTNLVGEQSNLSLMLELRWTQCSLSQFFLKKFIPQHPLRTY